MQILTYPVGVVVGVLPIIVELGLPPRPASLHLDGEAVCALTAEFPGCAVDLGPSPKVHLLELVRGDASGRIVERVSRWVNRPGADQAEVQTRTTCRVGAKTCDVLVGWAHPERLSPSRVRATLDGKPVPLPKNRALTVPAGAARGTLLTVELTFPDGRRATYAGAVGGRTHGDESVSVVPILHEDTCAEGSFAKILARYESAHLPVRAVEPGASWDWQVTFVAQPSVLDILREWFEERKASLLGPRRLRIPDRLGRIFGGKGGLVGFSCVAADQDLREFDLLQDGSPELWVERVAAALRRGNTAGARMADAVAAAGFHAGAAPRRRAVVLLLGNRNVDSSVLPASGVPAYLDEIRVPFEAWNLAGDEKPDWPRARRLATPDDFYEALVELRRRVWCQAIAWVEADFTAASAAARAAGTLGKER